MAVDPRDLPSWSEFLFVAQRQGVVIRESDARIAGPRGPVARIRYLRRGDDPPVVVSALELGEIVQLELLTNLCRRLRIDPTPLGIAPEALGLDRDVEGPI